MVAWLAQNHELRVVTTFPYYPEWKKKKGDGGFRYRKESLDEAVVIRCPHWVKGKMSALERVLHLSSFAISSFPVLFWNMLRWRPEVVYTVAPTLLGVPMILLLSKLLGIKTWVHVQDFEVEVMLGMSEKSSPKGGGWIGRLALSFEKWCLCSADRVSSISPAMLEKLLEKGVAREDLRMFPNWVDLDYFKPASDELGIRNEFGYSSDDFIILYAGNIGLKQGLDQLPELVKGCMDLPRIKFLIVGEGGYRASLQEDLEFGVSSGKVRFLPLQPLDQLVRVMTLADIHLILQKKEVKDLVLPSKLTTILSMGGNSIITSEIDSALGRMSEAHPGITTLLSPGDSGALLKAVQKLSTTRQVKPNKIARDYAEEFLGKPLILKRFEEDLKSL